VLPRLELAKVVAIAEKSHRTGAESRRNVMAISGKKNLAEEQLYDDLLLFRAIR
jgi:hypothetical protein